MSIRLMSLVWEITWPTQSQLLVALKLADHANDDGSNVYPAKASIARLAQCSESTVQNALRAFRDCGLLSVIRQGGNGPKDPTVYAINVHLLTLLANAKTILTGGSDRISIPEDVATKADENKGSTVDPLEPARGQSEAPKGSTDPAKGSKALTPNHHLEPSREPSHARSDFLNGEGKGVPRFEITTADAQWKAWLDHLRANDPGKLADAEAAGRMTITGSKWPDKGKLVFVPSATLTQRSKAMTGDAA
jgi:hypothetical protein